MVNIIQRVMISRMMEYNPVLKQRHDECDEKGHVYPDKKNNKCYYCFRRLDYGDNKGLDLGVIKLAERGNGLKMLVKENDPGFYKRYLDSFSSSRGLLGILQNK
ncbi:hypothetical protein J4226_04895 [Candidatus Pacearchaeota archaeon]|nr:hypothetical protein [Candidatus Pacearchaeota archaeon]